MKHYCPILYCVGVTWIRNLTIPYLDTLNLRCENFEYVQTYRVSQIKWAHVLNGCSSYKKGTGNKKRVSFEKFMKLSFQWALKLSIFNSCGLRKMSLEILT